MRASTWALADLEARFWEKVDRSGGLFVCWRWQGAFNRPSEKFRQKHRGGVSRRPVFKVNEIVGVVYAHRFALALTDDVPLWERAGLEACHRSECGHYWCVNPAHLYWGTPDENRADRYKRLAKMTLPELSA